MYQVLFIKHLLPEKIPLILLSSCIGEVIIGDLDCHFFLGGGLTKTNTNLVNDIEYLLSEKFRQSRFSGCRGKFENFSADQRPWWPFLYARLQTGCIKVWWCPSGSPSGSPSVRPSDSPSVRSPSAHFPHFSPTCFDILSWNFAHDFVLMYYRSNSTVITLLQFLKELCLFVNLE